MELVFPKEAERLHYAKLGDEPEYNQAKNVWVFPNIEETLPAVHHDDKLLINPFSYYITSGEAVRKTEVLIRDVKRLLEEWATKDNIVAEKLTDLLTDAVSFLDVLLVVKASSKYLELTKCEDGLFSGNICARKDPKKKKAK